MHRDTSTTYSCRLGRGLSFLLATHLLACRALPADVGPIVLVISCIRSPFSFSLNGKP